MKLIRLALKRSLDLLLGIPMLVALALPFLLILALIKLDSAGPAFFRQERVGRNGRRLRPFKFRTMVVNAESIGLGVNVSTDDARITRVGRLLRNWGLDELPQLINVVKGEMSLVGPRPTLPYQVEQYQEWQRRRLLVKPGINGWALVHGRNRLTWQERIQYDVWYVDHWSLWIDIRVLFRTLWIVLITREGVYGEGGVNDDFRSSSPQEGGGGSPNAP
jgi:lipopolysaccharide/colanic/teichoic acid biosynthesis glycosyltransferase